MNTLCLGCFSVRGSEAFIGVRRKVWPLPGVSAGFQRLHQVAADRERCARGSEAVARSGNLLSLRVEGSDLERNGLPGLSARLAGSATSFATWGIESARVGCCAASEA